MGHFNTQLCLIVNVIVLDDVCAQIIYSENGFQQIGQRFSFSEAKSVLHIFDLHISGNQTKTLKEF